jgi:hypothetical protein
MELGSIMGTVDFSDGSCEATIHERHGTERSGIRRIKKLASGYIGFQSRNSKITLQFFT